MPASPRAVGHDLVARVLATRPAERVLAALREQVPPPVVGGVTGSLVAVFAAALAEGLRRPLLVVVPSDEDAEGTAADLELLGAASVYLLPAGREGALHRSKTIAALERRGTVRFLVASARSVADPVPSRDAAQGLRLDFAVGERRDRDEIVAALAAAGFVREAIVVRSGTFSVRGDILDVATHVEALPLRIEFLDDRVEGLRRFDPASQLSIEVVPKAGVSLFRPEELPTDGVLVDHLEPDTVVLVRDPAALEQALERHLARHEGEARALRAAAFAALRRFPEVVTTRLKGSGAEFENLGGQVIAPEGTAFSNALATLERVTRGKAHSVVAFDNDAELERFRTLLAEEGAKVDGSGRWLSRPIDFVVGRFHEGFHAPLPGIAAVSHGELFATAVRRRAAPVEIAGPTRALDSFLDLAEGDIVVHLAHGIARFVGIEHLVKGGSEQDFLALEFKDEVRLLVPVSKIDLVQKYVGGKGEAPDLSKLGGSSWQRRKDQVSAAVSDLAADLLEHQAIRARKAGIPHPADTPWQQEFEAAFPFTPTPDQARAVVEIKRDMESPRPMDRLVCGDVGYGKTEVAMRAAFKCVMGGRQVAMLVPTTLLAEQHWDTFRERMKDYPVTIECLSRFRTADEQEQVLAGVAAGAVDILVGTHRILQGDVRFKELGLLVIDEEQRFGVADKEKLRKLRQNVDVLVMTATPIPRTLHQSLVGIREISSLTQAPTGRREIESDVVAYSDALVRKAILREIDRGGQAFFVHNRVHSIDRIATKLRELVPEARFLVGHGQMGERTLERTMLAFLKHEADVLVATTIVESGLDIPNANTLFVDDADLFGLAELHQLRGRVGRSHHQAYAYFLVREARVLSDVAEKRLRAIEEFTRLGSGFQIALRDMEIRGAGNILGPEQSGHIASVGYEMYCRLLDAAVKRLRKEEVVVPEEVELNLDFTAFLPGGYVPDRRQRVELYRKLGRAQSESDFAALLAEMRDRFGPPPPAAEEFVLVSKLRALMERHRVQRLEILPGEGPALRTARLARLRSRITLPPDEVRTISGNTILLVHPAPFSGPAALLAYLEAALASPPRPPAGASSGSGRGV